MDKFVIPNNGMPSTVNMGLQPEDSNNSIKEVTPEYLDSIIKNPRENPSIRANAVAMKKRMFPEEERVASHQPEVIPTIQVPTDVVKPNECKVLTPDQFKVVISDIVSNLYNQKITLLANPEVDVCLRSMTVNEYKFLSKQIEIYENVVSQINKNSDDYTQSIKRSESILLSAIDNTLQRCITNNIPVSELNFYDWVRLVGVLRLISKGDEKILKIKCPQETCTNTVDVNVDSFVSNIGEFNTVFIKNPIEIIPYKNIQLYVTVPTRGDIVIAEAMFLRDANANLDILNLSMHVKAFVKDNQIYLMNPEQRAELLNSLDIDVVDKIKEAVEKNTKEFYRCVGTYKCSCGKDVTVQMSDFLLFFFTL